MDFGDQHLTITPDYFFDDFDIDAESREIVYQAHVQEDLHAWAALNGVEDYFLDVIDPQNLSYEDFVSRLKSESDNCVSYGSSTFIDCHKRASQIDPNFLQAISKDSEIQIFSQDFPEFSLEIFRDLNNIDPGDPMLQFAAETRLEQKALSEYVQNLTPGFIDPLIEVDLVPNVRFVVPNFALQFPSDSEQALQELRGYFYSRIESPAQQIRFQFEIEAMIQKACRLQGINYTLPPNQDSFNYAFIISTEDLQNSTHFQVYDHATGQTYRMSLTGATYQKLRALADESPLDQIVLKINRLEFLQNEQYATISEVKTLPDGTRHISKPSYTLNSQNGEIHLQEIFDWQSDDAAFKKRSYDMAMQGLATATYSMAGSTNPGGVSQALVANLPRVPMTEYNTGGIGSARGPYAFGAGLMSATDTPIFFNPALKLNTMPSSTGFLKTPPSNMVAQSQSGLSTNANTRTKPITISGDVPPLPSLIQFSEMTTYKFWAQTIYPQLPKPQIANNLNLPRNSDVYILPPITQLPQTLPAQDSHTRMTEPSRSANMSLPTATPNTVYIWDGVDLHREWFGLSAADESFATIADFELVFQQHVETITLDMDLYLNGSIDAAAFKIRFAKKVTDFMSDLKKYQSFQIEYDKSGNCDFYIKAWLHDFAQPLGIISGNLEIAGYRPITPEQIATTRDRISGRLGKTDTLVYSSMLNASEGAARESLRWHNRDIAITIPDAAKQVRATTREQNVSLDRILHNWFTNAARYQDSAKATPCIDVIAYKRADGKAVIEVTDNGVGFRNDNIGSIGVMGLQERRVDIAESTGTGLYSVIDLAKKNGWGVEILTTEGQGTTWRLILPLYDSSGQLQVQEMPSDGFFVIVPVS